MAPDLSLAQWLAGKSPEEEAAILAELSDAEKAALATDWRFKARPNQLAPEGDWKHWVVIAGRSWGKTKAASEWILSEVRSGRASRIALVGRTAGDVREVMIEGRSGVLTLSPKNFMPKFEPSKRRLTWPNGAVASLYYGESPDLLRGPEHSHYWLDEGAAFKYPIECWDNLMMGLRVGPHPRGVFTTTPRPVQIVKDRVKDPRAVVVRGSTFDNAANLPASFLEELVEKYDGTRIGRQELFAEILEDTEGALWTLDLIESTRVKSAPSLVRIVVAIDPAVTSKKKSDETGIVVIGIREDGHGFVLEDRTGKHSPDGWAKVALDLHEHHGCDCIVAEVNNGGDLVEKNILDAAQDRKIEVRVKQVHASRGKVVRAEPIVGAYERGKVHHVGCIAALEDEMCSWVPGERSPNHIDALVWGATELRLGGARPGRSGGMSVATVNYG